MPLAKLLACFTSACSKRSRPEAVVRCEAALRTKHMFATIVALQGPASIRHSDALWATVADPADAADTRSTWRTAQQWALHALVRIPGGELLGTGAQPGAIAEKNSGVGGCRRAFQAASCGWSRAVADSWCRSATPTAAWGLAHMIVVHTQLPLSSSSQLPVSSACFLLVRIFCRCRFAALLDGD